MKFSSKISIFYDILNPKHKIDFIDFYFPCWSLPKDAVLSESGGAPRKRLCTTFRSAGQRLRAARAALAHPPQRARGALRGLQRNSKKQRRASFPRECRREHQLAEFGALSHHPHCLRGRAHHKIAKGAFLKIYFCLNIRAETLIHFFCIFNAAQNYFRWKKIKLVWLVVIIIKHFWGK